MPSTPHQPTPGPAGEQTGAQPELQERARELLGQDLVGVEMLLERGMHAAATTALRTLLTRTGPELAGEILANAQVADLAREQGWAEKLEVQRRRHRDVRWVPGSRVARRKGEKRPAPPRGREGDAEAAAYLAAQDPAQREAGTHRGGWDGEDGYRPERRRSTSPEVWIAKDEPRSEMPWGQMDYDRSGVPGLNGASCLNCRLERTPADRSTPTPDEPDGLCVECRELGVTRDGVIQGYCALVARENPKAQALEVLRDAYRKATRRSDRDLIKSWVSQNKELIDAAPSAPSTGRDVPDRVHEPARPSAAPSTRGGREDQARPGPQEPPPAAPVVVHQPTGARSGPREAEPVLHPAARAAKATAGSDPARPAPPPTTPSRPAEHSSAPTQPATTPGQRVPDQHSPRMHPAARAAVTTAGRASVRPTPPPTASTRSAGQPPAQTATKPALPPPGPTSATSSSPAPRRR